MKVEVISSHSIVETQDRINGFLLDNSIKIVSIKTEPHSMHDLFYDGSVCNQWIEYITTIIHE